MVTKTLLTHPAFSRIEVAGETVARIDLLDDGTWRTTDYTTGVYPAPTTVTTGEGAIAWLTAFSLSVILSE